MIRLVPIEEYVHGSLNMMVLFKKIKSINIGNLNTENKTKYNILELW